MSWSKQEKTSDRHKIQQNIKIKINFNKIDLERSCHVSVDFLRLRLPEKEWLQQKSICLKKKFEESEQKMLEKSIF